jgi:TrmH family RNA methyltransferase
MAQELTGQRILDRFVVVLYEPQDLVNIALVLRAMKNMGLTRLHLVEPAEFDAYRIEGIAHDTAELVETARIFADFDGAVRGSVRVVATTARRRASRQEWSEPESGARALVGRALDGDIALVFGREDKGLPNHILDRCHEAICVPTSPEHASMNLGHAAAVIMYELRKAVSRDYGLDERSLHGKPRDQAPPATAEQMEGFFRVWQEAMDLVGMFRGVAPTSRMRSYRRVFKRADPNRHELRLLEASAYRIVHYARRMRRRLEDQIGGKVGEVESGDESGDEPDGEDASGEAEG